MENVLGLLSSSIDACLLGLGAKRRPGLPIVRTVRKSSQNNRNLVVESAAFGLGYTAVLIWGGSALVASFTDGRPAPYWPAIPHLRTDTTGVIAFAVAIVSLSVSKYLQLRRRSGAPAEPTARPAGVLRGAGGGRDRRGPRHRPGHLPVPERLHPSHYPAAPADASVAVAERGHGPGDRARHLPGRRRHQPLPAGHRGAAPARPQRFPRAPKKRPTSPRRARDRPSGPRFWGRLTSPISKPGQTSQDQDERFLRSTFVFKQLSAAK